MKITTDWDKIKTFYYVAKAGNLTHAALKLNISQPALSRAMQLLEHQLNVRLFERMPRGLVLTRQGEILLEAAEKTFENFSQAEVLMLEDETEPQGDLKIATTMAIATVWIIHHISDFIRHYPKLRLTIIGNDEQLDLKTRQADVSIRPFINNHPELIQEPLFTFNLKLYASKEYLREYGVPKVPEDLDHHRMIVFGYDAINPYHDINWPLRIGMPKGLIREPFLCINTSSGMRQAAENNLGIIALAAEYPGLENSKLVEVLPDIEKPNIPIYYVYPLQLQTSRRIKLLGDYLKNRLQTKN